MRTESITYPKNYISELANYRVSDAVYVLSVLAWLLYYAISSTMLVSALPSLRGLSSGLKSFAIALLIAKCLFTRYTVKELIIIGIVIPWIAYAAYCSGRTRYLVFFLFAIGIKGIDLEVIIRIVYRYLIILIPLVAAIRLLGAIPDHDAIYGVFQNRYGIPRLALGFSHPNGLGIKLFELVACHVYLNREHLRIYDLLFTLAIAAIIYFVPNTLSGYVACLIVGMGILASLLIDSAKQPSKLKAVLFSALALGFNIYSLVISITGTRINQFVYEIDSFASSRLALSHLVVERYGIHLFGQVINVGRQDGTDLTFLDNTYVDLAVRHGIIVYIIMTILLVVLIYRAARCDLSLAFILLIYSLIGIMASGIFDVAPDPFILAAGSMLYGELALQTRYEERTVV